MKLVVTLPLPHKLLHSNARPHHMAKARLTKKARQDAHWATRAAMRNAEVAGVKGPIKFKTAAVKLVYYFGARSKFHDPDGLTSWAKALLDGVADGGIVANDSAFTHLPAEQYRDLKNPRLEVHIEGVME